MDFLHRLAAAALGDSAPLRAALPARYAGPAAPTEVDSSAQPVSPPPAPATRLAPMRLNGRGSEPARRESVQAPSRVTRVLDAEPDRLVANAAARDRVPSKNDAASRAPDAAEALPPARRAAPVPEPVETPSSRQTRRREAPLHVAGARPDADLGAPDCHVAPLHSTFVAMHAERVLPASAAPVIHVTIDRIDVRAPAAAAHRPSKPSVQRPEPAKSLTDYLRGRSS